MREPWTDLAQSGPSPSVFLTHEWFAAAWAWRRLDAALSILVAHQGQRVVGVLPLIVGQSRRARDLELLTVPDTQCCDLLADQALAGDVSRAFASALVARDDWDTLRLDYLSPSGQCATSLLPALTRARAIAVVRERGGNAYVALDQTWADYYKTRSRRLKKALNLAANRLAKAGTVTIEWLQPEAGEEGAVQSFLETAIDVSANSWKRSTGNSLGEPGPQAFIRALSEGARRRGWLSIWTLALDGRPVAMEYELVHEGRVHALRGDFVADIDALSPGSHLFRHLLEALFDRGLSRYYLGPGDNPYKARWTDSAEPLVRVAAYNRTHRGRAAYGREELVKPVLRRLRDTLSHAMVRRKTGTPSEADEPSERPH